VALLFILFAWVRTFDMQPFTVQLGLTLVDVASLLLIAHIVLGASFLHHIFGSRPLVWIGQRSYGIYLYHYPILLYISGTHRLYYFGTGLSQEPIRLLAPIAIAALSYRFIEQPFRGHGRRPVTAPEPELSV
jgi:peptidoglycan/LPS O-acetylase OafA/YrhL